MRPARLLQGWGRLAADVSLLLVHLSAGGWLRALHWAMASLMGKIMAEEGHESEMQGADLLSMP